MSVRPVAIPAAAFDREHLASLPSWPVTIRGFDSLGLSSREHPERIRTLFSIPCCDPLGPGEPRTRRPHRTTTHAMQLVSIPSALSSRERIHPEWHAVDASRVSIPSALLSREHNVEGVALSDGYDTLRFPRPHRAENTATAREEKETDAHVAIPSAHANREHCERAGTRTDRHRLCNSLGSREPRTQADPDPCAPGAHDVAIPSARVSREHRWFHGTRSVSTTLRFPRLA